MSEQIRLVWELGYRDIRARAEKEDHAENQVSISWSSTESPPNVESLHKGVRKANFSSVNGAIAGCLDEGKVVGIFGIEYDAIESLLSYIRSGELAQTKCTYLDGVHDCLATRRGAQGAENWIPT